MRGAHDREMGVVAKTKNAASAITSNTFLLLDIPLVVHTSHPIKCALLHVCTRGIVCDQIGQKNVFSAWGGTARVRLFGTKRIYGPPLARSDASHVYCLPLITYFDMRVYNV